VTLQREEDEDRQSFVNEILRANVRDEFLEGPSFTGYEGPCFLQTLLTFSLTPGFIDMQTAH
jgi:hypothetical protein